MLILLAVLAAHALDPFLFGPAIAAGVMAKDLKAALILSLLVAAGVTVLLAIILSTSGRSPSLPGIFMFKAAAAVAWSALAYGVKRLFKKAGDTESA
jgi:peptidoglycan/LPS O-acetylase OafA/YrhL